MGQNRKILATNALISFIFLLGSGLFGQGRVDSANKTGIPKSYSNLYRSDDGQLFFQYPETGEKVFNVDNPSFRYDQFQAIPVGIDTGVNLDFNLPDFEGKLYYGLINEKGVDFPQPVFFKYTAEINGGKAFIPIGKMTGKYDFTDWEKTGDVLLGYRVLSQDGDMLYDSRVRMKGKGPFETATTIIDGPYLNILKPHSAVISFTTNMPAKAVVTANGKKFKSKKRMLHHEVLLENLPAGERINYVVQVDDYKRESWFETPPENGMRKPFTFCFASDSRAGKGGGERNIYGSNAYIVKKIAALAVDRDAAFVQFTGDLISGYNTKRQYHLLQYQNFRRSVEPFAHRIPFVMGMGNHEALNYVFPVGSRWGTAIDKFPWDSESAEAVFAENFVNPVSDLKSEDGAEYDPDPATVDFPPYDETVFCYTYDNVAMVVLNSNYWYAPVEKMIKYTSGNVHGYIMDNQLEWLRKTIATLENDPAVDHIFVTIHTPAFPNGGHSGDDMWYGGNNEIRPYVAGKPVDKGIIQRRDEFLDILINQSKKTVALLCGDEHNYSRLRIDDGIRMYPDDWPYEKVKLSRTLWQLTDGAAGAPYYAQEQLPWSDHVEMFSTQFALIFFEVNGKHINVKVVNPDTFEMIETFTLR